MNIRVHRGRQPRASSGSRTHSQERKRDAADYAPDGDGFTGAHIHTCSWTHAHAKRPTSMYVVLYIVLCVVLCMCWPNTVVMYALA
jgi:hypothetical protein